MSLIPVTLQKTSPWVDKRIMITENDGETQVEVGAKVFGAFAVHPARADGVDPAWLTLTHVPTGTWICHLPDEASLMAAGEYLWNKHCMTFRSKSRDEVKTKTEGWAIPWRDACMAEGKFLVPQA